MTTRTRDVESVTRYCERYWRGTGVPRSAISDMRLELESHLREAVADGRSLESVVGEPVAFAENWAREFRAPLVPVDRQGLVRPALAALGLAAGIVNGMQVFGLSTRAYSVRCCPRVVTETSAYPELLLFWLTLGVAALALAGAVSMVVGRPRLAALLWGIAVFPSVMTAGRPLVTILLLLAVIGASTLFRRPRSLSLQGVDA